MRCIICLCSVPYVAVADIRDVMCTGSDWVLSIQDETASFSYLDRESDLDIMQTSTAEGADWPIAMTVVGPRDSAIVLLEAPAGAVQPVRVLTQRGETPILLAGNCRPMPQ